MNLTSEYKASFWTRLIVSALAVALGVGCTAESLQHYSVNQGKTVADFRYQQSLDCLATVAANHGAMPSYSLLNEGTATLKDTGSLASAITWTRAIPGFASATLVPTLSRSPTLQWTIGPVGEPDEMRAIQAACQWAVYGPSGVPADSLSLLAAPSDPSPGSHFDVACQLTNLPACWLGIGRCENVPPNACYKANCGKTWVWLTPSGMDGLSRFTLILLDIATVDPQSLVAPRTTVSVTTNPDADPNAKCRYVKGTQSIGLSLPQAQAVVSNCTLPSGQFGPCGITTEGHAFGATTGAPEEVGLPPTPTYIPRSGSRSATP